MDISPAVGDLITAIANIALALSFVVALIFGVAQVRAASRDRRERLTLEMLENFQTREFATILHYIGSHTTPTTMKELRALPHQEQIIFIQFGQQMESLGIAVAEGIVDIDLVDKALGSYVATSWLQFKPLNLDLREKLPDPYLAEYFQWLAERFEKRLTHPREPFYKTGAHPKRRKKNT